MRCMALLPFCILLPGADLDHDIKMEERKALRLYAESSPPIQANVYENATNLLPQDDEQIPPVGVPNPPGALQTFIRNLAPYVGGSLGGICGAAVGGQLGGPPMSSGLVAGSTKQKSKDKKQGEDSSDEESNEGYLSSFVRYWIKPKK